MRDGGRDGCGESDGGESDGGESDGGESDGGDTDGGVFEGGGVLDGGVLDGGVIEMASDSTAMGLSCAPEGDGVERGSDGTAGLSCAENGSAEGGVISNFASEGTGLIRRLVLVSGDFKSCERSGRGGDERGRGGDKGAPGSCWAERGLAYEAAM